MTMREQALCFGCCGEQLVGVLSMPESPADTGLLIVVGGPQYRAGSHRQFVLLARHLAENGVPVLRFDYRGMGDASGALRDFEQIGDDLRAATDAFFQQVPGLSGVAVWGLCDAASAALFYAHRDPRVKGLALLNPWVRTEAGLAKAYLKHYYLQRLTEKDFWLKFLRGGLDLRASTRSFFDKLLGARRSAKAAAPSAGQPKAELSLPERMCDGLARFSGRVLLILSGDDLTAQEFREVVKASPTWQKLLSAPRVVRHELAGANHTFSRREWRDQVTRWTLDWVKAS